jgi:L-seryl-tRNA(Ser) seleniumtransferase
MTIKPPDLLNRLPSVSELLDKPPIRALADRWNRSAVAAGVRSFLEELRSDLQRRAAEMPSIRELAERAARYVASREHHSLGVAINATGRFCGPPWISAPLAANALERTIAFGREYAAAPRSTTRVAPAELESLLCRLTGAQAATVVHSYSGAIWLALSAVATDREVLVARAEVGDVSSDDSLPKLAMAARALLKEVGTTNRSAAADYEAAISSRAAAILKLSTDSYHVAGEIGDAELDELVAVARDRELLLVDALGAAPLVNPPTSINWPRRSAQASAAAGADLTIIRGDGLVNGPSCGILLGSNEIIRRIVEHPLYPAWQIDPLRASALLATAACYDGPSLGVDTLPLWQCLSTSVENLQNRAERMAAQLAHADVVASAVAVETRSPLSAALAVNGWPSYAVVLTAANGDIASLDNHLKAARFPIVGRIESDRIVLDLRTVIPRQDKLVVDSLLGHSPADTTT